MRLATPEGFKLVFFINCLSLLVGKNRHIKHQGLKDEFGNSCT